MASNSREAAKEIADACADLALLARQHGLDTLAFALDTARTFAADHVSAMEGPDKNR
jgi:hypothetical protein